MKAKMTLTFLMALLVLAACSSSSDNKTAEAGKSNEKTAEVFVSAAASLTDALNEMKSGYEKENDIKLTYNFASSGKLAAQIEQGAPADLFLSASEKDMDTLEGKGLLKEGTREDFTQNILVLIVNDSSTSNITTFEDLDPSGIDYFAIGEPESVPAGRYTKQTLEHLGLWDALAGKLVLGSDVRQVLTHVEMGNADYGVVYSSDAAISDKVKVVATSDPKWHDPIVYPGAVIADSAHSDEAQAFFDYLQSDEGREILAKYGFQ